MESFLIYCLKSSLVLAIFWGVYRILLSKETFFIANRWFLNVGMLVSILLPLIYFKNVITVEVSASEMVGESSNNVVPVESIDYGLLMVKLLFGIYLLGVLFLMGKLIFQLSSLFKLIKRGSFRRKENNIHILINEKISPFSFFNYIVYNPKKHSEEDLQTIIAHEKVHAKQVHSLDVIFVELFSVLFWFNPLTWSYKKLLTQNLEFLADRTTVESTQEIKKYQYLLLETVSGVPYSIANPFYNSLIKNRIVMLQKQKSQKKNIWKYALIFPLLAGFMMLFSFKTETKFKIQENLQKTEIVQDSTFSDNPLVVIDGVVMPSDFDLDAIDPETIATMNVSKGEIAIAKYGEKAKNGLIEITLKTGNELLLKNEDSQEKQKDKSLKFRSVDKNGNVQESLKNVLYVVNGKVMPADFDVNAIDLNSISNVNVYKGENAIEKYGEKAKDGVIEISLKKWGLSVGVHDQKDKSLGNLLSDEGSLEHALYIVDGEEKSAEFVKSIEYDKVKSVSVLKNEQAVSLYGAKGKNGVVIVELRK
ncbi:M56 family metallopeptidase [Galbibacter mesophilus]|uniref:M56 family metallopeptidase n=1 Tax=Galbibacter mesophilus TaxID=379069 RepID=UPI00191DB1AB|nr:M56 family metallopeptidase [Galbibacter mesophilus]MCM5664437.1 M56 family metallopeptidase [Galbibacter mesophilus]